MEYYSAINRNEIVTFAATWMDLEIIMVSEISQIVRHKHCVLSLICRIKKKKRYKTKRDSRTTEKLMVTKGDRLRGRDGLRVWDRNVVKLGCDDSCTLCR